jgi:hypothetical protein
MPRLLLAAFFLPLTVVAQVAVAEPTPAFDPVVLQVLEKAAQRALAAYNASNLPGLRAELAKSAPGLAEDAALRRLFVDYYHADFGKLTAVRLDRKATVTHRDRGVLVYDAVFEKAPRAKIGINFTREDGALKIAQLRLERIETTK